MFMHYGTFSRPVLAALLSEPEELSTKVSQSVGIDK